MTQAAAARGPLDGPTGRVIAAQLDLVRSVLNKHGMTNPELFGSVARGDDQPGSDVDILVDFPKGVSLFGIAKAQAELEGILGAPVDLVPRSSLKPLIRDHIQADLIPL